MGTMLTESIAAAAEATPDHAALIDRGRWVTYRALWDAASRMAAWLVGNGLDGRDVAGVTVRDNLHHAVASLGLMRLGCTQIGLPSHDTHAMRLQAVARTRTTVIIGETAADAIDGAVLLRPDFERILADRGPCVARPPRSPSDGAAVLFTTSGTTGRPKLIPLTDRLFAVRAALFRQRMSDVRYMPFDIEFPQTRRWLLQSLAAGGCTVLPNNGAQAGLLETCRRHGVTHLTVSPSRAETLLHEAQQASAADGWPAGTLLSITGAQVPGSLRRRVQEGLTRDLSVPYGTTECGAITRAGPADHAVHPDGVGRPVAGCEVAIVDDRGRPLPAGETGFVRVRMPGLVAGYLDDDLATARAFLADGWFQPGDLACLAEDGTLLFSGRADDMMVLGSINIFPAEIERAAEGFPGLADCAAFAYRATSQGDIPMLAAVEHAPGSLDAGALMLHCRAMLGLRAPRRVLKLAALPRNGAGKVLRAELAAIAGRDGAAP